MKTLLTFIVGIICGMWFVSNYPIGRQLEQKLEHVIEEKASSANVENYLAHHDPAGFENACRQRAWDAPTETEAIDVLNR